MIEVVAGIDWGTQHNCLVVMDLQGDVVLSRSFAATPSGIDELQKALLASGQLLRVAIESAVVPVAATLLAQGAPLFSIAPGKLAAYRGVHRMSPRKDDVFDAWLLADMVRVVPDVAVEILPRAPARQALRRYSRERDAIVAERTSLTLALQALVSDYYPQLCQLPWTLTDRVLVELLVLVPDPRKICDVTPQEIKRCLGRTRLLNEEEVHEILSGPRHPMVDLELDACVEIARQKAQRLLALRAHERQITRHIQTILDDECGQENLSDAAILLSMPGAGPIIAATILSEASMDIASGDRQALRRKSIAPVTMQSGTQHAAGPNKPSVRRRYAVNKRLARAMYLWGAKAMQNSPHYAQMYGRMRKRGLTHGRSCRQIADRLLPVLFAMLRDRTLYQPAMHGATRTT